MLVMVAKGFAMNDEISPVDHIARALAEVGGVVGIVLGGSRARGTNDADSDYDIGVYYNPADLRLDQLSRVATELDDAHRDNLVAPPGTWGEWVNGGAWLTVGGVQVDLLLRDMERVRQSIDDCLSGTVSAHYQTGHPHACLNTMYASELAIAAIVCDTDGQMAAMWNTVVPYPEPLRNGIMATFGFEMGFSAMLARNGAGKNDSYYAAAHVCRSIACMNLVLFALNREHCINEKKAVSMIGRFSVKPNQYAERVAAVVAGIGNDSVAACDALDALVAEVREFFPG